MAGCAGELGYAACSVGMKFLGSDESLSTLLTMDAREVLQRNIIALVLRVIDALW